MPRPLEEGRGCSAIPQTPYKEDYSIDWEVLEKTVEFDVLCGTQSITGPVMASEFQMLSEDERYQFIKTCADVIRGRTVYIAGCSAPNGLLAARYAEHAQKCGADAVIAMFTGGNPTAEVLHDFFRMIDAAVTIPVMIQSVGGASVSAENADKICGELKNVKWVKEEAPPAIQSIYKLSSRKSPHIKGIFSGNNGECDPIDFRRGAVGSVVASYIADVESKIWALYLSGKVEEADKLHFAVLEGKRIPNLFGGMAAQKECLKRRGIFKNTITRVNKSALSQRDLEDITVLLGTIEPYYTFKGFSR